MMWIHTGTLFRSFIWHVSELQMALLNEHSNNSTYHLLVWKQRAFFLFRRRSHRATKKPLKIRRTWNSQKMTMRCSFPHTYVCGFLFRACVPRIPTLRSFSMKNIKNCVHLTKIFGSHRCVFVFGNFYGCFKCSHAPQSSSVRLGARIFQHSNIGPIKWK